MTTDQQFWMRHCISLDQRLLNTAPSVLARLYTPDAITHIRWLCEAKERAFYALQTGVQMDVQTRTVADYLLAYADAHIYFYGAGSMDDFQAAMTQARERLLYGGAGGLEAAA